MNELIKYTTELAANVASVSPDMYYTILAPKRLQELSVADMVEFAEHFKADVSPYLGHFEAKASINGISVYAKTVKTNVVGSTEPTAMDLLKAAAEEVEKATLKANEA